MMKIPLVDLTAQYRTIRSEIDDAIRTVLKRGDFINGEEVTNFEQEFATYIGAKHVVGVANGTDAIRIMLRVAGIQPGDQVITQANTFIATVIPIIELGAKPILVDCLPDTGQIDISQVAKRITKKTRAIIPVHLFGLPAPMHDMKRITNNESRITILEDAAQGHGSYIGKQHVGTFGTLSSFSFYPGKNLGAYGDAGAIATDDDHLATLIRIIGNVGQDRKYHHPVIGINSRLDTLQAAILRKKLKHLRQWNTKRRILAQTYLRALKGIGDLILPNLPPEGIMTNWHIFTVQTKKRDSLQSYLLNHGIHTGVHYPIPLHKQPALSGILPRTESFPHTEKRAQTMLSLPLFAELTDAQVAFIIRTIQRFFAKTQ